MSTVAIYAVVSLTVLIPTREEPPPTPSTRDLLSVYSHAVPHRLRPSPNPCSRCHSSHFLYLMMADLVERMAGIVPPPKAIHPQQTSARHTHTHTSSSSFVSFLTCNFLFSFLFIIKIPVDGEAERCSQKRISES